MFDSRRSFHDHDPSNSSRHSNRCLLEQRRFPRLAPDFVIELRSASDDLETLQDKMQGTRRWGALGMVNQPQEQQVEKLSWSSQEFSSPRQPSGGTARFWAGCEVSFRLKSRRVLKLQPHHDRG